MIIELDVSDKKVESDIRKVIAFLLYDREIYSLGKASEFASVSKTDFMKLLREKNIYIKYSIDDVKNDLSNLSQSILDDSDKWTLRC